MSTETFLTGRGDVPGTLVCIFLRGAADGLSLVPPLEDDAYHRARPTLRVKKEAAIPLDGFFGLHPLLKELEPAWKEGELAIVHGTGSEDETRSHFAAQDFMEHGGLTAGGWLGRFLRARTRSTAAGALPCVAMGKLLPESLGGAPSVAVMPSLDDFSFGTGAPAVSSALQALYAQEVGPLGAAARDTFSALERIQAMRARPYQPERGATYGTDGFAQGLLNIARLIKAQVGLEVVSLDLDGWDTHLNQVSLHAALLPQLSRALAAFRQDLGPRMRHTTVVVMTEFGRRVQENSAFGTDHGRGGVLWVMGGGVRGGRVLSQWRGLQPENLEGPGDVPVLTNYRHVLASVLLRHGLEQAEMGKVFPDFSLSPLALY